MVVFVNNAIAWYLVLISRRFMNSAWSLYSVKTNTSCDWRSVNEIPFCGRISHFTKHQNRCSHAVEKLSWQGRLLIHVINCHDQENRINDLSYICWAWKTWWAWESCSLGILSLNCQFPCSHFWVIALCNGPKIGLPGHDSYRHCRHISLIFHYSTHKYTLLKCPLFMISFLGLFS